jgi:protein-S-isoprenylcysteine O-methyltransferase Ste14
VTTGTRAAFTVVSLVFLAIAIARGHWLLAAIEAACVIFFIVRIAQEERARREVHRPSGRHTQ